MKLIKTKSFELAAVAKGEEKASKLFIALPGRLDTKDYWNFGSHLEVMAQEEYYCVCFDPPGTWESPGGIGLFTTTNYIKAVDEVIEYFGTRPTLLFGHSRGGATAALVAATNPAVCGLITINESLGAPSAPDPNTISGGIYVDYRDVPPGDKKTKERKRFEVPLPYFEDGKKYDDAEALKSVTVPKLMFYSENDEFCTPNEVMEVFGLIPDPKVLHKLVGTHDYRYYPGVVDEVNKVMSDFVEKYWPN